MSLAQLKQEAKEHVPKIKQYYIKSRHELIRLLTMKEFPQEMVVEKKTIAELRKEAQLRKLPNLWKLRRAELVELLYPRPQEDDEDNDNGEKHNNPKEGEGEKVGVKITKDPV